MLEDTKYKQLYVDLFELVRASLGSKIIKDPIVGAVTEIYDSFVQDQYNPLLLYFYTNTKVDYLCGHITNNVILTAAFSVHMGLSKEDAVDATVCAFCHDFGMSDYISLFQKGHNLTERENAQLRKHPLKSAELFTNVFSEKILRAIVDVHEQVNAQGYPANKNVMEISPLAKIVSICDVFEALTHKRNFRNEFTPYESMKMIISKKNIIFLEDVVKKFVNFMSVYPIGSLVFLNTGETAIVIGSNDGFPTRSIVRVLLTPRREIDNSMKIIDLLHDNMVYITSPIDLKSTHEILNVLKPRGEFEL